MSKSAFSKNRLFMYELQLSTTTPIKKSSSLTALTNTQQTIEYPSQSLQPTQRIYRKRIIPIFNLKLRNEVFLLIQISRTFNLSFRIVFFSSHSVSIHVLRRFQDTITLAVFNQRAKFLIIGL